MSFDKNIAISYLKSKLAIGEKQFNIIELIKSLSIGNTIGLKPLNYIMVDFELFFSTKATYSLKNYLGDVMCKHIDISKISLFYCDILQLIKIKDLSDNTDNANLLSALNEYIKQQVKDILYDIDSDVLEYVQAEARKAMEECENE